jgi:hypothetical protein
MYGGHRRLEDTDPPPDHLHHGRDAVGRATGAGDNLRLAVSGVDAVHDGRHVLAFGRARDDHEFRPGLDVLASILRLGEEAGALQHDVHTQLAPGQTGRVALAEIAVWLAVDDQIPATGGYWFAVAPVNCVVLDQVGDIVKRGNIIDGDKLQFGSVEDDLEGCAPDASQSIDADLSHHRFSFFALPCDPLRRSGVFRADLSRIRGAGWRMVARSLRHPEPPKNWGIPLTASKSVL